MDRVIRTLDDLRVHILSVLPEGRDHALSAKWLARELGVSTRIVGQLVERAILEDGKAIGSLCGKEHGYYLIRANDPDDLAAGVGHSVRRAVATFARIRALRRNFEALPGAVQTSIFDELDRAMHPDPMELLSLGRDPVGAA